jgi:ferric-dicitrate binding protein FerR (iron transport regulator)
MDEDKILDKEISRLVRSLEKDLPPGLEERTALEASIRRPHRRRFFRKWQLALAVVPGAAALFFAFFLLLPAFRKQEESYIIEIRTQFELVDKNITIIFIQRPDFKLFKED